ncbi:MAG: metal ABC transporter permease [Chitinophagaceae bacterium]|nr:metal ABC transporter permease [Oligoflexus sp.]
MMENFNLFFSSYELWGGAVAAGVCLGVVCGFLGLYVILHRIVFVSAAMSQISSLGVMLAFFFVQVGLLEAPHPFEDVIPLVLASLLTGVFAVAMAGQAQAKIADRSRSAESLIGAVYLISTAGLIMVGDRITRGAHDVANILFGNAVAVDNAHLIILAAICVPVLGLHIWLRKDLLFISFDPTMAATLKYPVVKLRIFILISLGIAISFGTRTIGALPVFSFSVLPPLAGLLLFNNLTGSFWASALIGGLSAFVGYFISFVYSFPTGACMTIVAGFFLLLSKVWVSVREG